MLTDTQCNYYFAEEETEAQRRSGLAPVATAWSLGLPLSNRGDGPLRRPPDSVFFLFCLQMARMDLRRLCPTAVSTAA